MPQSLSSVYLHLTSSTHDRYEYFANPETRERCFHLISGISRQLDCPPVVVGGHVDHIHILAKLGRTISQSEWVKEIKRQSNLMLKEQHLVPQDFSWQGGFAAFSVAYADIDAVRLYIESQEEHHKKESFQEEFLRLLKAHDEEWDERYIFQ